MDQVGNNCKRYRGKMKYKNENGFTLVELLIATGIAIVVMASVYSVYYSQQKSYVSQEQIVAMQQNLRAGMTMLSMDIMSAGYDPTGTLNAGLTIISAQTLQFTRMDESSGTTIETIQYGLDFESGTSIEYLYREVNGTRSSVAENIDEINSFFFFHFSFH